MKIESMGLNRHSLKDGVRLSIWLKGLSSKEMKALEVLGENGGDNIFVAPGTSSALLILHSSDD